MGRARRGASGALYPKTAIAGLNPCLRSWLVSLFLLSSVDGWVLCNEELRIRQVWKEAAVSGLIRVTWSCLIGASWQKSLPSSEIEGGCTT